MAAAVLAAAFLCGPPGQALASPLDEAALCGQLFPTQTAAAKAAMPSFIRLFWVATKKTKVKIDIDLVVYGKTSAVRYTGFACTIGANNVLTVLSPKSGS